MRKLSVVILMITTLVLGCSKKPNDRYKLLLDWFPNANHLPLIIAEKKGIFQKHGIFLEILQLQDAPSTLAYLKNNQADLAVYYYPSALKGYKKYPHYQIIGKLFDEPLFCLMSKTPLTLEAFSDKTLGSYGDFFSLKLVEHLKRQSYTFSKVLYSHCDQTFLLYFDQIDVASGSINVEAAQLKQRFPLLSILSWQDLNIPKHPELVVIAQDSVLEKDPLFKQRFQAALQEAITFCQAYPNQAIECYFNAFPEKQRSKGWEIESCLYTIALFSKTQTWDPYEEQHFDKWLKAGN